MQREFLVVVEQDADGYYVASVPELRGCHTQARTHAAVIARIREAISLYLDDGDQVTVHAAPRT